jgi:HlyD family secretion protein
MKSESDDVAALLEGGRRRGRWARPVLWLLGLAVAALVAWALIAPQDGVDYVTEPVTRGPLVMTVTATGTVQPTTKVEISSELSGEVVSIEVDYNDAVEVGQVLARLDDTRLAAQVKIAEASLASAEAMVTAREATAREAQANFESEAALGERGVTTRRSLILFRAANERAVAELAIARADLKTAESNLAQAQVDLDKSVLRSPIRGIVLDRVANVGQVVASSLNTPTLFTLAADLARMELRVDVDEADIGRVAVGQDAVFTVDAFQGRSFPARITQIRFAPETTQGVVTYKAILSVDNADKLLRPGMTATATITVSEMEDALRLPNAALRFEPPQKVEGEDRSGGGLLGLLIPDQPEEAPRDPSRGSTAWVLRGGVATEVPVTVGDSDGLLTAVTGGELAEGDEVITDIRDAP